MRKIAARIQEIADNSEPSLREKVLNEATVKYNGHVMTLQQFLDNCGLEMQYKNSEEAA